jgi:hypothetical protein
MKRRRQSFTDEFIDRCFPRGEGRRIIRWALLLDQLVARIKIDQRLGTIDVEKHIGTRNLRHGGGRVVFGVKQTAHAPGVGAGADCPADDEFVGSDTRQRAPSLDDIIYLQGPRVAHLKDPATIMRLNNRAAIGCLPDRLRHTLALAKSA